MKYEIRSLKGYRSGVRCIWEKEILVREQLFHHAYGVRQLPDQWSLYKQDFLELVQERIVHIWHITNLTVTTAEGVESGLAKSFFWQKAFDLVSILLCIFFWLSFIAAYVTSIPTCYAAAWNSQIIDRGVHLQLIKEQAQIAIRKVFI